MTLPTPPGYKPTSHLDILNAQSNQYYARRPKTWVPPLIMVSSFSAGYAIPWNLGPNPVATLIRFIFPLIISAILCCIASFFAFEANKNWRIWSWVAFGFQFFTFLSILLSPTLVVPNLVLFLLGVSVLLLGIASAIGPEKLSEAHKK